MDTPDFYWDRESLEDLYTKTCTHLAVSKRTRVVNEKLTHCLEIMEMIRYSDDSPQPTPCYKQFLPGLEEPEKSADAKKSEILR